MKKLTGSLPFRLLLGVAAGILIGLYANEGLMNLVVTLNYIMGQFINFCVPLIIIGFIAPSITKLGSNASRMLGIALLAAYASSLGAALFSMAAGFAIIPGLHQPQCGGAERASRGGVPALHTAGYGGYERAGIFCAHRPCSHLDKGGHYYFCAR